eukprot:6463594-Amphidinium_carterae.1
MSTSPKDRTAFRMKHLRVEPPEGSAFSIMFGDHDDTNYIKARIAEKVAREPSMLRLTTLHGHEINFDRGGVQDG